MDAIAPFVSAKSRSRFKGNFAGVLFSVVAIYRETFHRTVTAEHHSLLRNLLEQKSQRIKPEKKPEKRDRW
ncbi:hypothetical protein BH23CYA1_BH23CYA1_16030 [soil metagenome]